VRTTLDSLRVTAHIDKYYKSALEKYQDMPYDELHEFLKELLTVWYDRYPPAGSKRRLRTLKDAEEGDVVNVAGTGQEGPAPAPKKRYNTQLPKRGDTTGVAPVAAAAEAATSVILHVHMCPTYIQHMHCFMWYVCKINTNT
jgi:hypothetical protein